MAKKKVITEAIPTYRLCLKSLITTETVTHQSSNIVQDLPEIKNRAYYKKLPEIMERTSNLKSLNAWSILLHIRKRTDFKNLLSCYHTTLFTKTMDDGL